MELDPISRLDVAPEALDEFPRKWRITELEVFGSVLRDDFRLDSDVDFLVSFAPDAKWSLLEYVAMEEELAELVRRPVDIIERRAVESSENYVRRRHILNQVRSTPPSDDAELLDILLSARRAFGYVEGVGRSDFAENVLLQDALLRCLGIIGLATRKLSNRIKDAHPEIAWDKMMHVPPGSRLWSHTSDDKLWQTVTRDLPKLVAAIELLVPPDEGDA
jgi:hypothetical protein